MSKKRKIANHNLEHIILNDIKQMDGDAFEDLIAYLYGVKVTNNEDETYTLETQEEDVTLEDIFGDINIQLFEGRFTEEEIFKFKKDWGQIHSEICANLGYDEEGADELLSQGDYFWDEDSELWLNKCASRFTIREQEIADYLRHKTK